MDLDVEWTDRRETLAHCAGLGAAAYVVGVALCYVLTDRLSDLPATLDMAVILYGSTHTWVTLVDAGAEATLADGSVGYLYLTFPAATLLSVGTIAGRLTEVHSVREAAERGASVTVGYTVLAAVGALTARVEGHEMGPYVVGWVEIDPVTGTLVPAVLAVVFGAIGASAEYRLPTIVALLPAVLCFLVVLLFLYVAPTV